MEIISLSLDNQTLKDLNKLQEQLGYKSRSRLIRATIGSLLNEYKVLEDRKGHCDAVFTVTHQHQNGTEFSKLMKKYESIIRTEVHQHHAGTCLRILIACGDAEQLRNLFSALKKEARTVSCSVL